MLRIKSLGPHCHEVSSAGLDVLFSYATPVAARLSDGTYIRSATRHSVTTSRHVNGWIGQGVMAEQVPQEILDGLEIVAEIGGER